jgi:hypothetical protein
MVVDWNRLIETLGSTAIIVAALGFVAKSLVQHLFSRDLDTHKADLTRRADHELAEARAQVDREIAGAKARTDAALIDLKGQLDQKLEALRSVLAADTARTDRIRQEVVRWANPILGSVEELQRRLRNILHDGGFVALAPTPSGRAHPEWSIRYEYFLPSTIYLFCQYFCWVRLLQESLSFELFRKHQEKDALVAKIYAVGGTLSDYPREELRGLPGSGDAQVFNLQQRALGELVMTPAGDVVRCMRYSEFLAKWPDPAFKAALDPLITFVDKLRPEHTFRWKRLELMADALEQLAEACRGLLRIEDR